MKALWIGFGLGVAAGALLLNNCKWMQNTVRDTQERVMKMMENKSEYDDESFSENENAQA